MTLDVIWYIFLFLCAATFNLVVHETSHFLASRRIGVDVVWWQFGVGPVVKRFTNKKGTEFRICLVPFFWTFPQFLNKKHKGTDEQGLTNTFEDAKLHLRVVLILVGATSNFILSFLIIASFQLLNVSQNVPVIDVAEKSVAYQVGLRSGDRIVTIDGRAVAHWQDVGLSLAGRVGNTGNIGIEVQRNDEMQGVQIPIDDWHASDFRVFIIQELGISKGTRPIIASVAEGSPADRAGFVAGDRILTVDGDQVATWRDFLQRAGNSADSPLDLVVQRGDESLKLQFVSEFQREDKRSGMEWVGLTPAVETVSNQSFFVARIWDAVVEWFILLFSTIVLFLKMIVGEYSFMNAFGAMQMVQLGLNPGDLNWLVLLKLWGLITIAQAMLSLFPGVMDGNSLALLGTEFVTGSPPSPSMAKAVIAVVTVVGFAPLVTVLILDGIRLLS